MDSIQPVPLLPTHLRLMGITGYQYDGSPHTPSAPVSKNYYTEGYDYKFGVQDVWGFKPDIGLSITSMMGAPRIVDAR